MRNAECGLRNERGPIDSPFRNPKWIRACQRTGNGVVEWWSAVNPNTPALQHSVRARAFYAFNPFRSATNFCLARIISSQVATLFL
jgi:hypothetical protein